MGRDFPPVQTGPGAHPASCSMGTGSFRGVKYGQGVLLTIHPLLVPWSWKSTAIPLPTLWTTTGPVTGTLYLYLFTCYVYCGCTDPTCRVTVVTEFCTGMHSIRASSVQNLLYVMLLAPRILRWHLDFWKLCVALMYILLIPDQPHIWDCGYQNVYCFASRSM